MPGAEVVGVAGDWAIADGWVMALDAGAALSLPGGLIPRCIAAEDGGRALVGTGEAHLVDVGSRTARGSTHCSMPSPPASWSTPWGGPPDTRSIALGPAGVVRRRARGRRLAPPARRAGSSRAGRGRQPPGE